MFVLIKLRDKSDFISLTCVLIMLNMIAVIGGCRYLMMSLDPDKIRKGDTVTVVSHVAANPAGKILAWRFVRQNWPEFVKR